MTGMIEWGQKSKPQEITRTSNNAQRERKKKTFAELRGRATQALPRIFRFFLIAPPPKKRKKQTNKQTNKQTKTFLPPT